MLRLEPGFKDGNEVRMLEKAEIGLSLGAFEC